MQEKELIPTLFKTEYSKIIAVLCKLFGIRHIEIAEDIVNDTFLLAAETWGLKGIPENPTAWLYTVAKNKTKDYLKRNKLFNDKIKVELSLKPNEEEIELDLSKSNIEDSQLQMIFAICNPIIPLEAQIGLALKILCGFGIDEIAQAFLTNKETINKRLFRAKEKLKQGNISLAFSNDIELESRLNAVLSTLYLLFNEGYYSTTDNINIKKDLCLEAMRLCYFLTENKYTNGPNTKALLALFCFLSSRFDARMIVNDQITLYDNQDRNLWNKDLIAKGNYYLIESAYGNVISKYHLEARIAYWHCTKNVDEKKWENILQLYNQLLQIDYSPMAALNRTFALSQVIGKEKAIESAVLLNLKDNHFYFALLGYLYTDIDNTLAIRSYQKAIDLTQNQIEKKVLGQKIGELSK